MNEEQSEMVIHRQRERENKNDLGISLLPFSLLAIEGVNGRERENEPFP